MENRRRKGRLERWNDDRGFGFIHTDGRDRDVFLHISAFKKSIGRRPRVGDTICYETHTGSDGKTRAVNATIEGFLVNKRSRPGSRPTQPVKIKRRGHHGWIGKGISFLLVVSIAVFFYQKYSGLSRHPTAVTALPNDAKTSSRKYSCQGKVYCSQMRSCQEAMFYQRNCPGTKTDGDHDGIPCESQWCGR